MPYRDFKDIARRKVSDKFLRDKAVNIAKNPKYDGYQFASMLYKVFDEKSASLSDKSMSGSDVANNENKQNLQLAEELHKQIIRKF